MNIEHIFKLYIWYEFSIKIHEEFNLTIKKCLKKIHNPIKNAQRT